ncbi:MAG: hypothetical protein KGH49_00905 [Candidatus Micrarchaeota archaeon]|nr:hypothetical protein [Candidatus Micrarchaeota archaeon]
MSDMTEMLRCGCMVDEGEFIVGSGCKNCKECNTVSQLHPFGNKRLHEIDA